MVNREISKRVVRSGERDIYDYYVILKENTDSNGNYYRVAIAWKQKNPPHYFMRIAGVRGLDTKSFKQAKENQSYIVELLKSGVNAELVVAGNY